MPSALEGYLLLMLLVLSLSTLTISCKGSDLHHTDAPYPTFGHNRSSLHALKELCHGNSTASTFRHIPPHLDFARRGIGGEDFLEFRCKSSIGASILFSSGDCLWGTAMQYVK